MVLIVLAECLLTYYLKTTNTILLVKVWEIVISLGEAAQAADQRKSYRQTDYDLSGNVLARRVMFKPMLGLFNQDMVLPLRYCLIQIELELVNSQADAVTTEAAEGFSNGANSEISDPMQV